MSKTGAVSISWRLSSGFCSYFASFKSHIKPGATRFHPSLLGKAEEMSLISIGS